MQRRTFLRLMGVTALGLAACTETAPARPDVPLADVVTQVASLWVANDLSLTLSGDTVTAYDADGALLWQLDGLNAASALAVYDGHVYVVDRGHFRVLVHRVDGAHVATWELPDAGSLHGIVVNDEGVFVADANLRVVHVLNHQGRAIGTIGADRLTGPRGLAWHQGELYVADAGRGAVEVFGADGQWRRTLGEEAALVTPRTVAVRADGALIVVDTSRREVVELTSTGVTVAAYRPEVAERGEVNVFHAVVAQDGSVWIHAAAAA